MCYIYDIVFMSNKYHDSVHDLSIRVALKVKFQVDKVLHNHRIPTVHKHKKKLHEK